MKKKILIICALILVSVFGFMYTQTSGLFADDKNKKDCSSSCTQKTGTSSSDSKSGCTDKNMTGSAMSDNKDGYAVYEFVTDKIHCDACKTEMSGNLMGIAGVKEVNYGETCGVSKMTNVKVYYSADETTPEVIGASVKEKGLRGNCEDGSKCGSKKTTTEKKL